MGAIDEAFHGLRRMIASGELSPGQQFPSEPELCAQLGVSRGSLREAVRMLGALGVIHSRHGSGTYVSALEAPELIGALRLTVELMPFDSFMELFELRRVLDAHAAGKAAARMTDESAAELAALLDELEAHPGEGGTEIDVAFHEAIARLAGNEALVTLLDVFRSRSRAYKVFDLPGGDLMRHDSDRDHREILAALVARDPVRAGAAAAMHVSHTEEWLRRHRPKPVQQELGGAG